MWIAIHPDHVPKKLILLQPGNLTRLTLDGNILCPVYIVEIKICCYNSKIWKGFKHYEDFYRWRLSKHEYEDPIVLIISEFLC